MALSNDLISQFVKATQDKDNTKKESTAYGKIVKQGDTEYVQLDGSDLLTPIQATTVVRDGDRVIVTIKNHTAIVTGDFTNPSANNEDIKELGTKISEFEIVIADKVSTEQLEAEIAKIDQLVAGDVTAINAKIETIEGKVAEIDEIKADVVEVEGKITAHEGEFTTIKGEIADLENVTAESIEAIEGNFRTLESDFADFEQTTTNKLSANEASIEELETKKLDTESAKIIYANIDFSNIGVAAIEKLFSDSGIIKDLIMSDGKVTGELVGVTIKGDLIEGNTVKADKLVILGEDGIYYKLNVDALGEATASSDEKYQNGLDGSVIIAKSITADKVAVTDLVAFGATIGGYHIDNHSLYSGAKSSVDNTTAGVFLGDDGQMTIGDSNNYLKFFKNESGEYKLKIQADSLDISADGKPVIKSEGEIEGQGSVYITDSGNHRCDITVKGDTSQEISPSFESESPVSGITGDVEIEFCNKNLLDLLECLNKSVGETYHGSACRADNININSMDLVSTGTWGNMPLRFENLQLNTDYTISADFIETIASTSKVAITAYGYNEEGSLVTITNSGALEIKINEKGSISLTFNTGNYKRILIRIWSNYTATSITAGSSIIETTNIQLERRTQSNYELHKKQTYILSLGLNELHGNETARDMIVKKEGKWCYEFKWEKYVFTGSETIVITDETIGLCRVECLNNLKKQKYSQGFSNIALNVNNWNELNSIDNSFALTDVGNNGNYNCFWLHCSALINKTTDEILEQLTENYVYYQLEEPIYEEITDEILIGQLDELEKATTYKNITHIFIDQNAIIHVKYFTEFKGEAAPEEELEELRNEVIRTTTNMMMDNQQFMIEALEEYVKTGDLDEYKETVATRFEQTARDFTFLFDTVVSQVTTLDGETQAQFQEIQQYIRFIDGNIVLGEVGNEITLKIQNDRISFLQNNLEVAYLNNNKLYVTDGEFLNSLQLGKFAFKPRANGSLSFGKIKN